MLSRNPYKSPSWKVLSFRKGRIIFLVALAGLYLWAAWPSPAGAQMVPARTQAAATAPLGPNAPSGNAFVSPLEPTLAPTPTPTASPTWTPTPVPPTATPTPDLAAAAIQISPLPMPGALMRPPLDVGNWLWVSGSALLLLVGALAMVVTRRRG